MRTSDDGRMTACIALLRGINVSGHKIVKMERLRASFASLGFRDVKTYVQSGNVVFHASGASVNQLGKKIARKILDEFGFEVPVFVRTAQEMRLTVESNPFVKDESVDLARLHVTFLDGNPPEDAAERLQPLPTGAERFHVAGRDIFLYCPDGYGETKLSNTAIEKKLALGATTRNWKTVNTLLAMAE